MLVRARELERFVHFQRKHVRRDRGVIEDMRRKREKRRGFVVDYYYVHFLPSFSSLISGSSIITRVPFPTALSTVTRAFASIRSRSLAFFSPTEVLFTAAGSKPAPLSIISTT